MIFTEHVFNRSYNGGLIGSVEGNFGFGTYEATIKVPGADASGVVAAFFLHSYRPDPNDPNNPKAGWHDEIDVELLPGHQSVWAGTYKDWNEDDIKKSGIDPFAKNDFRDKPKQPKFFPESWWGREHTFIINKTKSHTQILVDNENGELELIFQTNEVVPDNLQYVYFEIWTPKEKVWEEAGRPTIEHTDKIELVVSDFKFTTVVDERFFLLEEELTDTNRTRAELINSFVDIFPVPDEIDSPQYRDELKKELHNSSYGYDSSGLYYYNADAVATAIEISEDPIGWLKKITGGWLNAMIEAMLSKGDISAFPGFISTLKTEYLDPVKELFQVAEGIHSPNMRLDEENTRVIFSFDPNDIIGPAGYGDHGYVPTRIRLPYKIRFENQPTATASAREVWIRTLIDEDADWRTFQLGEIGFGEHVVTVPDGLGYFKTQVDLRPDGIELIVNIEAGLNIGTGEAFWHLWAVDPETGEFPEDATLGFLPPNNPETHDGEGYVKYSIKPLADSSTGSEISAKATIIFDNNEPIDTNTVSNLIDAGPPSSSVDSLPEYSSDELFSVSWNGLDDAGGAGLEGYDVYVSDNDGAYELWLNNTIETSAEFEGQFGHTYRFYSVARDYVGNTEEKPNQSDAMTIVANFAASNPEPYDGKEEVPLNPTLAWMAGFESELYDLYIWKADDQKPATPNATGLSETGFSLTQDLISDTIYNWQIIAKGAQGEFEGPIWHFKTSLTGNHRPAIPYEPAPADGETVIAVDADLVWQGGDPDAGDTVTHDIYFGTSTEPAIAALNQSEGNFDPGILQFNTSYFWKIVARDNKGAEAEGPVWSFTTFAADGDEDEDGLSNEQEITLGTKAFLKDSDNDGSEDGEEVSAGSDPTNGLSFPKTTSLKLQKGFNLVSIPDVASKRDLRDWLTIFGDASEIEKVITYDTAQEKLITLIPEDQNNPEYILPTEDGLIVYALTGKDVVFYSVFCTGQDLAQGMNLTGFACPPDGYTAFNLLDNLGSSNIKGC